MVVTECQILVVTDLLDQGSGLVHVEHAQLVLHISQTLHQANILVPLRSNALE